MIETEIINKIDKEFIETIYKHLPSEWISGNGSCSIGPSFNARLNKKNSAYVTSDYFYKGERKFVHWTTVNNLMSIINNREIKLYNLHKSSDEQEFNFVAEQLTLPENSINHSKNYLFTFSFCEIEEMENQILWTEYGKDYSGVAIEFEIENDPINWDNFMLSQCYYQLPVKFTRLFNDLEKLKQKWNGIKTNIDLGRLIAFHKHTNFNKEKEIRLSSYFPYDNIEEYWKYCNTEFIFDKDRPRITEYFGLKLWVDNDSPFVQNIRQSYDRRLMVEDNYFKTKPKIVIKNISFGEKCGIKNKDYLIFRQRLEEIFRLKLGYRIELPLNMIKKH